MSERGPNSPPSSPHTAPRQIPTEVGAPHNFVGFGGAGRGGGGAPLGGTLDRLPPFEHVVGAAAHHREVGMYTWRAPSKPTLVALKVEGRGGR